MSPSMEDLTRLVSLLLGVRTVHADDRLIEDLGAESADLVNLVATVEDKYQVVLDEEAVARVHTVADLYALVNRQP
jgi:acyl carrier protein